ncbi:hypothetical protein LTR36_004831 [Oleoguttula mirabilis]|uniref:Uncharacterized protein n=1 Tax=Oleoguttula mirabilis TaxID=1507867 RepID=A0AAV9JER4_9PEZI|nr:hypothetical protein LTR36_004831 [Oleoguttula mirabilis]
MWRIAEPKDATDHVERVMRHHRLNEDLIGEQLRRDTDNTSRRLPTDQDDMDSRRQLYEDGDRHNHMAQIPLFKLSPELLDSIYDLVLMHREHFMNTTSQHLVPWTLRCDPDAKAHIEPALLRVCRKIRQEARAMHHHNQHFEEVFPWVQGPVQDIEVTFKRGEIKTVTWRLVATPATQ